MYPYLLLFVVVSANLLMSKAFRINIFYYLSGIALVMFAGLRNKVGVDYDSYVNKFSEIQLGSNLQDLEPMNMLLINFAHLISANDYLIFLLYSAITLSGIFYFSKRVSISKEISIFTFMTISIFYFSTFNIVRQWAAISMMLFAITSLLDRKYYRMVGFIALASMIHLSALLLVVIPFLAVRFSRMWVLVMVLSAGLLAELALFIIEKLPFSHYLVEAFRSDRVGSLPIFLIYVFFLIFSLLLLGYFNPKKQLARHELIILNMCLMSAFILFMGFVIGLDFQTTMRANVYFSIQLIALIPWILSKFSRSFKIVTYPLCLVLLSGIYWGTLFFKGTEYMLTPFVFVGL
jgi:transmembrane protein EpsG